MTFIIGVLEKVVAGVILTYSPRLKAGDCAIINLCLKKLSLTRLPAWVDAPTH